MAAYPRGDYFAAIGGRNRSGATVVLQCLKEMNSYYVNEHIVNLLLEVRGNLLSEKDQMLSDIDRFLSLPPEERLLFAVGRRFNVFFFLDDLKKSELRSQAPIIYGRNQKERSQCGFCIPVQLCDERPRYKKKSDTA